VTGSDTPHAGDGQQPAAGQQEQAALERLAAALSPRDFATALTAGPGHRPFLTVTSRHIGFGDNIYADPIAYTWSWCEQIAPASDPLAAAAEISKVLGTSAGPSHG
jgi:hypothetical protein